MGDNQRNKSNRDTVIHNSNHYTWYSYCQQAVALHSDMTGHVPGRKWGQHFHHQLMLIQSSWASSLFLLCDDTAIHPCTSPTLCLSGKMWLTGHITASPLSDPGECPAPSASQHTSRKTSLRAWRVSITPSPECARENTGDTSGCSAAWARHRPWLRTAGSINVVCGSVGFIANRLQACYFNIATQNTLEYLRFLLLPPGGSFHFSFHMLKWL